MAISPCCTSFTSRLEAICAGIGNAEFVGGWEAPLACIGFVGYIEPVLSGGGNAIPPDAIQAPWENTADPWEYGGGTDCDTGGVSKLQGFIGYRTVGPAAAP